MIGYQRERLHHLLHMAERFLAGEADSPEAARDLEREASELLAGDAELGALAERLAAARGHAGEGADGLRPAVKALHDALARRLP